MEIRDKNCSGFSFLFCQLGPVHTPYPRAGRGRGQSESLPPPFGTRNPRTGSKLSRLMASTRKCLAQSNKSPRAGTATKEEARASKVVRAEDYVRNLAAENR